MPGVGWHHNQQTGSLGLLMSSRDPVSWKLPEVAGADRCQGELEDWVHRSPQGVAGAMGAVVVQERVLSEVYSKVRHSLPSPTPVGQLSITALSCLNLGLGIMGGNMNLSFLPSLVHLVLFLCSTWVL